MSGIISDIVAAQEEKKSLDKKEIEDEEKEKMLNVENKLSSEVAEVKAADTKPVEDIKPPEEIVKPAVEPITEEGREVKPKYIPIGAIKMPGFFTRSKSKEKCKDGDDGAGGELLEKTAEGAEPPKDSAEKETTEAPSLKARLTSIKITNPFAKKPKPAEGDETTKETDASNTENPPPKKGLLNAIRLPLANMIPRKLRGQGSGNADPESGLDTAKQAELASMETLDDNKDTKVENPNDDGMENVKLEIEDKPEDSKDSPKENLSWQERIRQRKFIIGDWFVAAGILVFILLVIIIIAVTASGGGLVEAPIKDGRYVEAVTSCGLVEGVLEDGAFAFRGIPYAVPPIGENRWRAAQPLNKLEVCWNGTFKAHNSTPVCGQVYGNGTEDGVEDCLTLDVITPHIRYDNPLPVIVLIGSNSLTGGTPGKLRPSTRYARSKDVLFVRPNFRVGVFGFLALDSLSKTDSSRTTGNYGLSDIVEALNWVRLNIKHFGGDPDAVTLFGHRAGATLVTALINYKKAENLFARAWVSSGSAIFPGKPFSNNSSVNENYLDTVRCADLKCLREKSFEEILPSAPDTWRRESPDLPLVNEDPNSRHEWLILDEKYVTKHFFDGFPETQKPVVIGTTAHVSASEKLLMRYINWTSELVTAHINTSKIGQLGLTQEALKRYNATYQGLAAMISDIRTVCPLLNIARLRISTPFYIVTQPSGENNLADVDSDISAILGRYEPKTPEQRRYVSAMQQLFYHYVWHGTVPQFDSRNIVMEVGQDILPRESYPNCNFWISNNIVPLYAHQD